MIVDTRRLFTMLLRTLRINVVCDVGSMNGRDALAFRDAVPEATIFAFEASPENVRSMHADSNLRERRIQVVPVAVSGHDGDAEFFVVGTDDPTMDHLRGMSSLHRRPREADVLTSVPVKTTRLDTFLADKRPPDLRLGLWIDVEGKAYEAIEGAAGLVKSLQALHVEVETSPCIGRDQRLYPEVHGLLRSMGFVEVATAAAHGSPQFDAVFVRRDLSWVMRFKVNRCLAQCRLRFVVVGAVRGASRSLRTKAGWDQALLATTRSGLTTDIRSCARPR